MPLLPFDWRKVPRGPFDTGREQAALQQCLYQNRRDKAEEILSRIGTDAKILDWVFNSQTLPPSWFTWQDGDDFGAVINGTRTELGMWASHFTGLTGKKWPEAGVYCHGYHLEQAILLIPQLLASWGGLTAGKRYLISGHSFGASVAHLIGCRLQFFFDPKQLAVYTLGEPRGMVIGYDLNRVPTKFRLVNQGDLITALPQTWGTMFLPDPNAKDLSWKTGKWPWSKGFTITNQVDPRKVAAWIHYGPGKLLFEGGHSRDLKLDETGWGTLENGASSIKWYSNHVIPGYLSRLLSDQVKHGGSLESQTALGIGLELAQLPFIQTDGTGLGPDSYYSADEINAANAGTDWTNIAQSDINRAEGVALDTPGFRVVPSSNGDFLGSSIMADLWDVTMCINNDLYGKSQTFGLNLSGSINSAYAACETLVKMRAGLLGRKDDEIVGDFATPNGLENPCVELLRIKDAKNPRYGQVFQLPPSWGEPDKALANGVNAADPLWNGLSISIYGECAGPPVTRARYTLTIVGFPDRMVEGGRYKGTLTFGGASPNAMNDRLKAFLDYLCDPANKWGFTGANPAVGFKDITAWAVNADGQLVATSAAHGYVTGERVQISRTKRPAVNKVWQVEATDANTFTLLGSQATPLQVPVVGGKARRVANKDGVRDVAFYQFQAPPGGWIPPFNLQVAKREPGRRIVRASFPHRPRSRT